MELTLAIENLERQIEIFKLHIENKSSLETESASFSLQKEIVIFDTIQVNEINNLNNKINDLECIIAEKNVELGKLEKNLQFSRVFLEDESKQKDIEI